MSAICGIFYRDGCTVNHDLIKNMNDKLVHRGPDGSKTWHKSCLGLGHQMLHTTEESLHEVLPFYNEKLNLAITSDARIDNRKELIDILQLDDQPHISDSQLILYAYDRWGENSPSKLLGDFAFVIWDEWENKLFCARDHMGVKPFYYYILDDVFAFATEIKALFSIQQVPKNLNEIKIADYLISNLEERENTFFKEIQRLPAANSLTIDFKTSKMSEYWHLDIKREISHDTDEGYIQEFNEIFDEAVQCRLRSSFPVGSMLSGGLDSSSIACKARELLLKQEKEKLKTFSFIFPTVPESDETKFIEEVINKGDFEANFIKGDELSPLDNIEEIIWHLDQPLFSFNIYLDYGVYYKARENDVRVLLDGYDGDTTLSHGELMLSEFLWNMKFIALYREIKGLSSKLGMNFFKVFYWGCIVTNIPPIVIKLIRFIREHLNQDNKFLNKEFSERINIQERLNYLYKYTSSRYKSNKEYQYILLTSGEFQYVLEVIDAVCGKFNIEPRYPFFDKRLIEFALALPVEQKMYNGWDRIILRRAMDNVLPSKVQWRPDKSDISPNFDINFLKFNKNIIDEMVNNNFDLIEDYIDLNGLMEDYNKYKDGDNPSSTNVWKAVNLILWLTKTQFD